jgi:hypothetical protein
MVKPITITRERLEWNTNGVRLLNYPYINEMSWTFNGSYIKNEYNVISEIRVFFYYTHEPPIPIEVRKDNSLAAFTPEIRDDMLAMYEAQVNMSTKKIVESMLTAEPYINTTNCVKAMKMMREKVYNPKAKVRDLMLVQMLLSSELDMLGISLCTICHSSANAYNWHAQRGDIDPMLVDENGANRILFFSGPDHAGVGRRNQMTFNEFEAFCNRKYIYAFDLDETWDQEIIDLVARYTRSWNLDNYRRGLRNNDGIAMYPIGSRYTMHNDKIVYFMDRNNLFIEPRPTDMLLSKAVITRFQRFFVEKYELMDQLLYAKQLGRLMSFQQPLRGPYKNTDVLVGNTNLDTLVTISSVDVLDVGSNFWIPEDNSKSLWVGYWTYNTLCKYEDNYKFMFSLKMVAECEEAIKFVHAACIAKQTVDITYGLTKGKVAKVNQSAIAKLTSKYTENPLQDNFKNMYEDTLKLTKIKDNITITVHHVAVLNMMQHIFGSAVSPYVLSGIDGRKTFAESLNVGRFRHFVPIDQGVESAQLSDMMVPVTWHQSEMHTIYVKWLDVHYIPRFDDRVKMSADFTKQKNNRNVRVAVYDNVTYGGAETRFKWINLNSTYVNMSKIILSTRDSTCNDIADYINIDDLEIQRIFKANNVFKNRVENVKIVTADVDCEFRQYYPVHGYVNTWDDTRNEYISCSVAIKNNVRKHANGWLGYNKIGLGYCGISVDAIKEPQKKGKISQHSRFVPKTIIDSGALMYAQPSTEEIFKDKNEKEKIKSNEEIKDDGLKETNDNRELIPKNKKINELSVEEEEEKEEEKKIESIIPVQTDGKSEAPLKDIKSEMVLNKQIKNIKNDIGITQKTETSTMPEITNSMAEPSTGIG